MTLYHPAGPAFLSEKQEMKCYYILCMKSTSGPWSPDLLYSLQTFVFLLIFPLAAQQLLEKLSQVIGVLIATLHEKYPLFCYHLILLCQAIFSKLYFISLFCFMLCHILLTLHSPITCLIFIYSISLELSVFVPQTLINCIQ